MVIKAVIYKASDISKGIDYEIELEFKDYNDMIKYMKRVYWKWIIRFPDGYLAPRPLEKLELEVYDDYVE
jgi:hypothetical protein